MRNGIYVALALCIALNVALIAGILASALNAGLLAALGWGGTAFLGVATLILTIMSMTGLVGRKP